MTVNYSHLTLSVLPRYLVKHEIDNDTGLNSRGPILLMKPHNLYHRIGP